ncbi:hypothetical protein [Pseudoalteromonas sp. Z1A8]|uniref:hypothetical protein n=1 Tax=Pseudoalteromonas sp. Z1A8 TaxID=2686354 RepID=UPI001408C4C6|nr:hypothetical protein [Pseudoalteromonas sp. Z1A8]
MKWIILLINILFLTSCSSGNTLPKQAIPTLIKVEQTFPKKEIRLIKDPEQIAQIIGFVNQYTDNWTVPWYGPPVGQIYFNFYSDNEYVGNFYVGPHFFGRDYGDFWSQNANKSDISKLGKLSEIDLLTLIAP